MALQDLLLARTRLRVLAIEGSVSQARPTALQCLNSGLKDCKLERLTCKLSSEPDLLAVASGVRNEQSIRELVLLGNMCFSFDAMARVCHELRQNRLLKKLDCMHRLHDAWVRTVPMKLWILHMLHSKGLLLHSWKMSSSKQSTCSPTAYIMFH